MRLNGYRIDSEAMKESGKEKCWDKVMAKGKGRKKIGTKDKGTGRTRKEDIQTKGKGQRIKA